MTQILIKEYYESKVVQIYVEDMELAVWYLIATMQNCIVRKIEDSFRIYNSNNNDLMCEFKSGGDISDVYHQSERVLW
jgi:hypothetical protein